MKIKSGVVLNGLQLINEIAEKPMKVSLAAKFLRLIDDLQKENNYIDKQRREIILKYCEKNENGEPIIQEDNVIFSPGNTIIVQKELQELSDVEVDIIDRNITEKDLAESNLELTIKQMLILKEFFHKEDEIEEEEENNIE